MVRKLRFLEAMTATMLTSHRAVPPFGLQGGEPGKCGKNYVVRTDSTVLNLQGNDQVEMAPGDLFVMETPGGGGFGSPSAA